MKNLCRQSRFSFLVLISFLFSCGGGNEGTICGYYYCNLSIDSLNSIIDRIYISNPNYIDNSHYDEKLVRKFITLKSGNVEYKLMYRIYNNLQNPNEIENKKCIKISLKSGAQSGEIIDFEKNISWREKREMKRIFTDSFIQKINKVIELHDFQ